MHFLRGYTYFHSFRKHRDRNREDKLRADKFEEKEKLSPPFKSIQQIYI